MDQNNSNIYARFASGELTASEIESLRASGELDQLQQILDAVDAMDIPVDLNKEASFESIQRTIVGQQHRVTKTRPIRLYLAIAASIILLAAVTFLMSRNSRTTIRSTNGQILTHILPDDSEVLLNDGSSIRYQANNFDTKRITHLVGEAAFRVEKGTGFQVRTDAGTVEVLGTYFNVRNWEGYLAVQCYEGSVRVTSEAGTAVLKMGEEISTLDMAIRTSTELSPLWQQGITRFDNVDLSSVFEELERQFDVEVIFNNGQRRFTGAFNHSDLESALKEICTPFGLTYTIDNQNQVVSIN